MKPLSEWTQADHVAFNKAEDRRRLEHAQFHGFRTTAEYETAMSKLHGAINSECNVRLM